MLYRLGLKVLGKLDDRDGFPGQSGSSQTDPKGRDAYEFYSHFLALSYLNPAQP